MSNLKTLSPEDFENLVLLFERALIVGVDRCGAAKNCLSCQNFLEKKEICSLAKSRPPARVIVSGCESWERISPF